MSAQNFVMAYLPQSKNLTNLEGATKNLMSRGDATHKPLNYLEYRIEQNFLQNICKDFFDERRYCKSTIRIIFSAFFW